MVVVFGQLALARCTVVPAQNAAWVHRAIPCHMIHDMHDIEYVCEDLSCPRR